MRYYQELTILPDPELSKYFIWQKVYMQIHLALVEHAKAKYGDDAKYGDIGVSFVDYACEKKVNEKVITTLGNKLRLFANTDLELKDLDLDKWLERLSDYVHVKSVQSVPSKHGYLCVARARQVKNLDQVTKRRGKRKDETFAEAKKAIIERYATKHKIAKEEAENTYHNPNLIAYPYVNMQSLHGKHAFPLEIKQVEQSEKMTGQFNTYGLSSTVTVPHW